MKRYLEMVDHHGDLVDKAFRYLWANPETGYKEWKTHKFLKSEFIKLGYELTEAGNIPGFCAEIDTGKEGPTILIFGEMDGLVIPEHPAADPETGAVHACGHCLQTAALLGLAAALKEEGALDGLSGKIRLVVVPSEEGLNFEFRQKLMEEGVIQYESGKIEFLHRGLLDGGDLAFMIHAASGPLHHGMMNGGSNGIIKKAATFKGVSAHAGGSPHLGINALYAANSALQAINALRETFKDKDHIRVHPVVSCGNSSVNAIPDKVTLHTGVRGATMDAVLATNKKINRAIAAAAASVGAKVSITEEPGHCPRRTDKTLFQVFQKAMEAVLESVNCNINAWGAGCSDMGDISSLMPTAHPYVRGAAGKGHGSDFVFLDGKTSCMESAKIQFLSLRYLLEDNAALAKKLIREYRPVFKSKKEFFQYLNNIDRSFDAVEYPEDGNVLLHLE